MGNSMSIKLNHENIFEKQLSKMNVVINDIISNDDLFKNKEYNFLSQDVCENYQVVLEEELSKHLKLDIKGLGSSLYIIPKHTDKDDTKLTKYKLTKKEVCNKISNHYIKILYIMCLVKYVYNLEKSGDLSIAGIIFRNIKIVDDMMRIYFCGMAHKSYDKSNPSEYKVDFSNLEGLKFFTQYFLNASESQTFIGILKTVLSRANASKVKGSICHYINVHGAHDLSTLESLYLSRFPSEKLHCDVRRKKQSGGNNLLLYIEKDNPVFLTDYCGEPLKIAIKLNTVEGKKILGLYKKMLNNYNKNIEEVYTLLHKVVHKHNNIYELSDIDKNKLDKIIDEVKLKIKVFYIQSIFDFQNLLDMVKKTPNIHI
jgi:hypothetical protein